MTLTKPLVWTAGQIRAAAKVAKEQNVIIKLSPDGSLYILPGDIDDHGLKRIESNAGKGYL